RAAARAGRRFARARRRRRLPLRRARAEGPARRAAAAGHLALPALRPRGGVAAAGPAAMTAHVAVVGGGITGLALALRLTDAGARATVFDAAPEFGGLSATA